MVSLLIPIPLSLTVSVSVFDVESRLIVLFICPLWGVNFMAFESRFPKICLNFSGSIRTALLIFTMLNAKVIFFKSAVDL